MYNQPHFNQHIKHIFICLLLLLSSATVYSQDREYLIKSAFIEKITRFIDWPENSDADNEDVVFGIITEDEKIFKTVSYYFKNQQINKKHVQVKRIESSGDLEDIDILYVTVDIRNELCQTILNTSDTNYLIFTDNISQQKNIHINLRTSNNRMTFQINPQRLEENGFYVNSKLYAYGEIINKND